MHSRLVHAEQDAAIFPRWSTSFLNTALRHKLCHFPGAKYAGGNPEVSILVPVLVLG